MTAQSSPASPAVDPGSVRVQVAAGIASVEFFHPKGNSLPGALLRRTAEEVVAAGERDDVRVVLLRSGGTGPFCAGASFDELKAISDASTGREFFMGFARLILAMVRCPKPVVARVHGKAVGGGVGVVAAADYSIATDSASLRLSELAVGIGPFVVGPVIERKIGPGRFAAMAVDADWRSAQWGAQAGLYSRVVGNIAELDDAVASFAERLCLSNPAALAEIKRVSWAGTEHWAALLEERAAISGKLVLSEFTRAAIAAFAARG